MQLENHHSAGVVAITDLSKNHQCMLRYWGKVDREKYLHRLTVSQHVIY